MKTLVTKETLSAVAHHFKKYDIDAIPFGCYAPDQSAFNMIERRMASLSHDLVGLVLPYDSFGAHIDSEGKTIDYSSLSNKRPSWNKRPPWNLLSKLISVHHRISVHPGNFAKC